MKYIYQEACAEVDFILNNLEKEYLLRIPDKIINLIQKNKARNYNFNIDITLPLAEQNLKEETRAILAVLYRKFMCSEEEREELEKDFLKRLKEEKKIKKVDVHKIDIIEENAEEVKEEIVHSENVNTINSTLPIINKEKKGFFYNIVSKIKAIFKIK